MNDVRQIELTRGLVALVDADDYDELSQYKWNAAKCGYAARRAQGDKFVYMHRQVLGLTDRRVQADHVNGNPLDNRKENLRKCTQFQNLRNVGKRNLKKSTSRFKGVYCMRGRYWIAQIQAHSVRRTRCCATELEAALLYNEWATELHGEFAWLNDVEGATEKVIAT